jgi:hypothetical protein
VYLAARTPGHRRTSTFVADQNPGFMNVWTEYFDAISPWAVGRCGSEADWLGGESVKANAEYLKNLETEEGRRLIISSWVLPRGSVRPFFLPPFHSRSNRILYILEFNLSEGTRGMNDRKRNSGRFLWR